MGLAMEGNRIIVLFMRSFYWLGRRRKRKKNEWGTQ